MSGLWSRTLVYLGLREEPEDHVEWDVLEAADPGDVTPVPAPTAPTGRAPAPRAVVRPPDAAVAAVRPIRAVPSDAAATDAAGDRVAVVQVVVFDDVETVGAHHRSGRPVLLDVSACERPVARRVIDFISGLTYASGGGLRRVSQGGFLLLPAGVELDAAERTRLERLGYPVDGPERG